MMIVMLPRFDTIREQIIAMRKRAGITQQTAADKADVSQSFIAKLESGQSTPNYDAVARLYNVLEELVNGQDQIAAQVMTTYVISVSTDDDVRYAASVLRRENISRLPVLDDGRNIGTVSGRSLLNADWGDTVERHMDAALPEVPEDATVSAIKDLLTNADGVLVRRQDDGIVGIITPSDLI